MKPILLFAFALLTASIGVALVFGLDAVMGLIYSTNPPVTVSDLDVPQPTDIVAGPVIEEAPEPEPPVHEGDLHEITFVCNDDFLRPFWIDLLMEPRLNSYLFWAKLQSRYDCGELLKVYEVDLNEDGRMEYAVTFAFFGVCSNRGNCPVALYGVSDDERSRMRTSAGVLDFTRRRLLFDLGSLGYELQKNKTNGYHDVMMTNNSGAIDASLRLYRFDGEKYRVAKCWHLDKPTDRRSESDCSEDESED